VELETLAVPLSLRDKRALQVLADRGAEPVGALVGRLIADHVATSDLHGEAPRRKESA
jgi:hypothetical protein